VKGLVSVNFVKKCLDGSYKADLIYRGSRDGFSGESFHKIIGGQRNLLSFIKSTTGSVFGGFTSVPWPKVEQDVTDSKSFMFSVDHKEKYSIKPDAKRAIRTSDPIQSFLFIYGIDDFYMESEPNLGKKSYVDMFGLGY